MIPQENLVIEDDDRLREDESIGESERRGRGRGDRDGGVGCRGFEDVEKVIVDGAVLACVGFAPWIVGRQTSGC